MNEPVAHMVLFYSLAILAVIVLLCSRKFFSILLALVIFSVYELVPLNDHLIVLPHDMQLVFAHVFYKPLRIFSGLLLFVAHKTKFLFLIPLRPDSRCNVRLIRFETQWMFPDVAMLHEYVE